MAIIKNRGDIMQILGLILKASSTVCKIYLFWIVIISLILTSKILI